MVTRRRRALVFGSPPLDGHGGVESVCRATVDALDRIGFETRYVSGRELARAWARSWIPWSRVWGGVAEVWCARGFARRDAQADLVVTNGPVGWGVRGRLSVHYYHGTYVGQAEAVRPFIRRRGYVKMRYLDGFLLERLAGDAKICLANSADTAAEVKRHFGHKCAVVWCPVDTDRFCPGSRNQSLLGRLGIPRRRPLGLFVGAGRPMKGARLAYEVMRRVSGVTWLVVGDGEPPPVDIADRVVVVPTVDPLDMADILRAADLFLTASIYEPFGLLVAEALACGTPVVCTRSGASDLLMAEAPLNEFVVGDPHDVGRLWTAVERVLGDPGGGTSRGARGEGARGSTPCIG